MRDLCSACGHDRRPDHDEPGNCPARDRKPGRLRRAWWWFTLNPYGYDAPAMRAHFKKNKNPRIATAADYGN